MGCLEKQNSLKRKLGFLWIVTILYTTMHMNDSCRSSQQTGHISKFTFTSLEFDLCTAYKTEQQNIFLCKHKKNVLVLRCGSSKWWLTIACKCSTIKIYEFNNLSLLQYTKRVMIQNIISSDGVRRWQPLTSSVEHPHIVCVANNKFISRITR